MRSLTLSSVFLSLVLVLTSCSGSISDLLDDIQIPTEDAVTSAIDEMGFSEWDENDEWDKDSATRIICNGKEVSVSGKGALAKNGEVIISQEGEYVFSGELEGNIVVEADKDADVQLIFDSVSITSEKTAPVNIKKAGRVALTLADNSENSVKDSGEYVYDDSSKQEPSAAIFSKSDLSINGGGSLSLNTEFNDGITSKDVLRISEGKISIQSEDDGIVGRDAVIISGGAFIITAGGDGIKSTNDEDATLGYVSLQGGSFEITSSADGIQAETEILISDGEYKLTTGGGSSNASYSNGGFNDGWGQWPMGGGAHHRAISSESQASANSAKAVKAGSLINISGGSMEIDSSDDSIHSNKNVNVSGGVIIASSGDDGIHADDTLSISGGVVTLSKSYEGLEACNIKISGGDIKVIAHDDGINGAGGNDGSSNNGRPGQNHFSSGNAALEISGGSLYISASGDGIDINGSAVMDGGSVTLFGPSDNGNGILDYDSSFEINDGSIVAVGSSGMLQGFSGGSQPSVAYAVSSYIQAGQTLSLESEDGQVLFSVKAEKQSSAFVFSSDDFELNLKYKIFVGEGDEKTEIDSFIQTETSMSNSKGGFHGGNMPGGGTGGPPQKPMR